MKNNPFPIKPANKLDLSFDETGSAYSNNYEDVYFQSGVGLEEKKYVFLQGNTLPKNWLDKQHFCIGETGFGTGLNFLNTFKLWHQTSNKNKHLDYISCELHPLNKPQLIQALSQFPSLMKYSDELINHYPEILMYGVYRINFSQFNVTLTLIIGDCVNAFENIDHEIDAWFLDGFNPSKNPQMWSDKLFNTIASLSHKKTTAATFTVARTIKDGLSAVGFSLKKRPGFGKKREMLTAKFCDNNPNRIDKQPWAQTFQSTSTESIAIVGAGIAGLTLADKLQKAGKQVTLIDRQKQPCFETSGNPQAMVMPSFDLNDSPEARFYLSAFLYAIRYYSDKFFHADGVLDLSFTEKRKKWHQTLLTRFELPNTLIRSVKNGLLFPSAGWLDTQGHAQSIYSEINNYIQTEIQSIEFKDKHWQLTRDNGDNISADCLVLANGICSKKLLPDFDLPTTAKHGEISYFKPHNNDEKISKSKHVLLNKGYITPQWNGQQTCGATFNPIKTCDYFKPPQTHEDHWQRNLELWKNTHYEKLLNQFSSHKSRAGIRVTTPDHLPICGPVIHQNQFKADYHDIRHGKKWKQYPKPQQLNNLYIFTGLGSRGFTSAPLLAEFLCNQITGHAHALDKNMKKTIHPNRFLYKAMLRG